MPLIDLFEVSKEKRTKRTRTLLVTKDATRNKGHGVMELLKLPFLRSSEVPLGRLAVPTSLSFFSAVSSILFPGAFLYPSASASGLPEPTCRI